MDEDEDDEVYEVHHKMHQHEVAEDEVDERLVHHELPIHILMVAQMRDEQLILMALHDEDEHEQHEVRLHEQMLEMDEMV